MKCCQNCGCSNNVDAMFCVNCGERMEVVTEVDQDENNYSCKNVIKERNIVIAIILSLITCGIYFIYWMIKVNDEVLELSGKKGSSGLVVFILHLVTFGIYGFYWAYKMGECVDKMKDVQNGYTSILYLVLAILGLNVVDVALIQDAINNKIN